MIRRRDGRLKRLGGVSTGAEASEKLATPIILVQLALHCLRVPNQRIGAYLMVTLQ